MCMYIESCQAICQKTSCSGLDESKGFITIFDFCLCICVSLYLWSWSIIKLLLRYFWLQVSLTFCCLNTIWNQTFINLTHKWYYEIQLKLTVQNLWVLVIWDVTKHLHQNYSLVKSDVTHRLFQVQTLYHMPKANNKLRIYTRGVL